MSHALLVYNPAVGQRWRRPAPDALRRAPARHGIRAELLRTGGQGDATQLVRQRLTRGVESVWVAGGDGTLGQSVAALVDRDVPIGILPTGTENVVAGTYGVPGDVDEAIDALASRGRTRPLRVWRVGDPALVQGLGVGFDALAMRRTDRRLKDWLGAAAIGAQGLREWSRYRFPKVVDTGEDEAGLPFVHQATEVLVSVLPDYAGPHLLAPGADPEDALIDVVCFRGHSRLRLAAFWLGLELPGAPQFEVRGVRGFRARCMRVAGDRAAVHVNGDPVGDVPLRMNGGGPCRSSSRDGRESHVAPSALPYPPLERRPESGRAAPPPWSELVGGALGR